MKGNENYSVFMTSTISSAVEVVNNLTQEQAIRILRMLCQQVWQEKSGSIVKIYFDEQELFLTYRTKDGLEIRYFVMKGEEN